MGNNLEYEYSEELVMIEVNLFPKGILQGINKFIEGQNICMV